MALNDIKTEVNESICQEVKFIERPVLVGHWQIGSHLHGISINMEHRPTWALRLFARWFFRWKWIDHEHDN